MTTEEKNKLIEDNMSLVDGVIHDRFMIYISSDPVLDYEDMYQSGCVGLIKAADKFDESKGYQFSTFAYYVIRNEIFKMMNQIRRSEDYSADVNKESLDSKVYDDDEKTTLYNTISDNGSDKFADDIEFKASYNDIMDMIKEREKSITDEDVEFLDLKIQGYAPKDIAALMHVDKKYVNIRLSATLRKIREKYKDEFTDLLCCGSL